MANRDRLAGKCITGKCSKKNSRLRNILNGGELAIDGFLQHHVLDDLRFGDAQTLGLLGYLLIYQRRAHKAGADDIGTDVVAGMRV